ncbi:MAG TPA: DUF4912 domain-containing protein [Pirellulales bacterium]|nr:DUF4912 domain-containing protein [Pirellulales bacterium]
MTPASLQTYTQKDLAQMARQGGVRGWHSMRKDQLIRALLSAKRAAAKKALAPARRSPPSKVTAATTSARRTTAHTPAAPVAVSHSAATGSRSVNGHAASRASKSLPPAPSRKPTSPRVLKHLRQIKEKLEQTKNLAIGTNGQPASARRDRIVVLVRDAFWLHAFWELTSSSIDRARAAMGQEWHLARPCLRLLEVSEGEGASASERIVEDIIIHGGVSNWYLHVAGPVKNYRVEIGYLAVSGRFFSIARSNVVTPPAPGTSDAIDEHWSGVAENFDKIYAMSGGYAAEGANQELQQLFEERLRRPMGSPLMTRYGEGTEALFPNRGLFKLEVDAEMILYGVTEPDSHVAVRGEPVKLRPDGSFTLRMSLPNQRQVIPVVASAANGTEQRTIVLALERNTKVMEPVVREASD